MAWWVGYRDTYVWWQGRSWKTGHQAVLGRHWLYLPSGVVICWTAKGRQYGHAE